MPTDSQEPKQSLIEIRRRYAPMRVVGIALFFIRLLFVIMPFLPNMADANLVRPSVWGFWAAAGVFLFCGFCLTFFISGVQVDIEKRTIRPFWGLVIPILKFKPRTIDMKGHLLLSLDRQMLIFPVTTEYVSFHISITTNRGLYLLDEMPTYQLAWKRIAQIGDALEMYVKDETSSPAIFRQPGAKTPIEDQKLP